MCLLYAWVFPNEEERSAIGDTYTETCYVMKIEKMPPSFLNFRFLKNSGQFCYYVSDQNPRLNYSGLFSALQHYYESDAMPRSRLFTLS